MASGKLVSPSRRTVKKFSDHNITTADDNDGTASPRKKQRRKEREESRLPDHMKPHMVRVRELLSDVSAIPECDQLPIKSEWDDGVEGGGGGGSGGGGGGGGSAGGEKVVTDGSVSAPDDGYGKERAHLGYDNPLQADDNDQHPVMITLCEPPEESVSTTTAMDPDEAAARQSHIDACLHTLKCLSDEPAVVAETVKVLLKYRPPPFACQPREDTRSWLTVQAAARGHTRYAREEIDRIADIIEHSELQDVARNLRLMFKSTDARQTLCDLLLADPGGIDGAGIEPVVAAAHASGPTWRPATTTPGKTATFSVSSFARPRTTTPPGASTSLSIPAPKDGALRDADVPHVWQREIELAKAFDFARYNLAQKSMSRVKAARRHFPSERGLFAYHVNINKHLRRPLSTVNPGRSAELISTVYSTLNHEQCSAWKSMLLSFHRDGRHSALGNAGQILLRSQPVIGTLLDLIKTDIEV